MEQVKRKNFLLVEYLFIAFIILWSGGSFTYGLFEMWPYVMFAVSLVVMLMRRQRIENETLVIVVLFSFVIVLQMIKFGGSMASIVAPILRILAIAMIGVVVRSHFTHVFIRVVAFFSFFSIALWLLDLTPMGHEYLIRIAKQIPQLGGDLLADFEGSAWSQDRYTLYLYTVIDSPVISDYYSWVRNSGPFFEPGRFSVFLSIALALILFNGMHKEHKLLFYLIFIANVTTFSTTGYFAMLVVFACYLIGRGRSLSFRSVFFLMLLILGAYFVSQFSFLSGKVSVALSDMENPNSRFGAMLYHWSQIRQSPLIGFGVFLTKQISVLEMSPCGVTDMMRIWGIPIFIMCIWFEYRGTRVYLENNLFFKLSFVTILLILAYTQTIMTSPFFFLLYLLGSEKFVYEQEI